MAGPGRAGAAPWEAPTEYLARVLADAGVRTDTAVTLTGLFERAKFSPHPVGPEMRQEAIDALAALPRGAPRPRRRGSPDRRGHPRSAAVTWLRGAWARLYAMVPRRAPSTTPPGRGHTLPSAESLELRRAVRTVEFSVRSAGDVHSRLRPALREVAVSRLASRRGIDLRDQPEAARGALGDDLWEFLRDDHLPPDDSFAPGIPLDQLDAMVATLEAL